MTALALLCLWSAAGSTLASADQVAAALDGAGNADLVLMTNPAGARPVRVLVATKVAAPAERLRQLLSDPTSYRKAMPSYRRTDVVSHHGSDVEIAWEVEVPTWNLSGKLWMRPQPTGVDLELDEGDFAPGLFHLRATPFRPTAQDAAGKDKTERSILSIEGHANLANANWVMRKLSHRSPLVEPMMTTAALCVMLRALAELAERGTAERPTGTMAAGDSSSLQGVVAGRIANAFTVQPPVLGLVRRRSDGRLASVEVAVAAGTAPEDASSKSLVPDSFSGLPSWKSVTPVHDSPAECRSPTEMCWRVESNLPFFSLGGTLRIVPQPWRARMVAGDTKGAVLGLDFMLGPDKRRTILVLSQHPRLDQAGFLPRKLIEAEPFLEHGLSLALTIVEAVSLVPALERL